MMTARKSCWYLSFVAAFLLGSVAAKASEYNAAYCQSVVNTLNIHWAGIKGPGTPCTGIEFTNGTLADAADGNISISGMSVSNSSCISAYSYAFTLLPDNSTLSGIDIPNNVPMTLTRGPGEACFVGHWVSGPYDYLAHIAAAPFVSSSCTITLSPTDASVPAVGGGGFPLPSVTTNCITASGHTVRRNVPWIHLPGEDANGSISTPSLGVLYSVDSNPGSAPRTGTITVDGQTFTVNQAGAIAGGANYQGLFWNAPAGSESGWGINFAHQGDVIFATWFTYDATGKALWLSMTATKIAEGVYAGVIYQTSGPAFSAVPFNPAAVTATAVGSGTLTFSDIDNGSFTYSVFGATQVKPLTRQVFGPVPVCTWGALANLALATNFQDLWWAAPAGIESGWGVNFTHQGDTIFATWFTYGSDGQPLWLSATIIKVAPGVYTGTLYRTTGPAFNAVPFLPGNVVLTPVGTLTVSFANGNSATFASSVNGVVQSKPITRQVFRAPGTACQ